jgi:hypothetical protein
MIEIISVPIIVTAVYWIMNLYKYITKRKEKYIKLIPIIATIGGAVLGLTSFFISPEIIPADNFIMALLIGGASGLAATGTNQIFKQIKKDKEGK